MIFVTVGTDTHDFSRLVKQADELASIVDDQVVIQIGQSTYEPLNAKWFRFTDAETIENHYRTADVIVTHAGAGSIINALKNGKTPIVVPRLKSFGEHVNDHQLDLARTLSTHGKVVMLTDVSELQAAVERLGTGAEAASHSLSPLVPYLIKETASWE